MAKLRYRFNNDILFKMLFVEHQNLLKSPVAAALGVREDSIDNLDAVNPGIPPFLRNRAIRAAAALTLAALLALTGPVAAFAATGQASPAALGAPDSDDASLTISLAGDTTLGSDVGRDFFSGVYKEKGAGWFFGGVRAVFANDDLTVVNLEGALTDSKSHISKPGSPVFYFRGSPGYTKILESGSVEICNIANNHSMDYGERGYADTKKALKAAGIRYYGGSAITVAEVKGVKIGFVGVQFTSSKSEITSLIDKAKKRGADVVVFTSHDGVERSYTPSARQREAAKIAIDAGADAAIFHHPHVIQGTETYKGKPIAWSLGNFCFGGNSNPSDKDSMIVQLFVKKSGGKIGISSKVIPARISSQDGRNDLRPTIAKGKTKSRIEKKLKDIGGDYLD
ncbi:MAG: CapA family protein [Clostridiales Family XIII bacterium]|jgi:poly-gamma-glutamate synthesis protein (capsule biosynthesis protein)|nr:CapA family protein [Clostridiales Family XIII bacterium]